MGKTLDLGLRLELLPMDSHCHNASMGLYRRDVEGAPQFLVHTYSCAPGTTERLAFLSRALVVMCGLEQVEGHDPWLRFPCGAVHERPLKRAFLDLCKLESDAPLEPKPLAVFDKKADARLTARSLGEGRYEVQAPPGSEGAAKRAGALARGFVKLCDAEAFEGSDTKFVFPCRTAHDALVGQLMFRAQNARASMREQELAAARGVLAAPSQQE